jgi:hypothetical protein
MYIGKLLYRYAYRLNNTKKEYIRASLLKVFFKVLYSNKLYYSFYIALALYLETTAKLDIPFL